MNRIKRIYKLHGLIRAADMEAKALADALGVSISQVEKDIRYLRILDVHIEHCRIEATYFSRTTQSELLTMLVTEITS